MADNNVVIDPRYMKYNKDEVEQLLDQVANTKTATSESVRSIVSDWCQAPEPAADPAPGE